MQQQQAQQQTGTRNETYDLIAVLYHALQGAENCQTYAQDAQNGQLRDFFQQALQVQRQLADQGKQVLQQCLQNDSGGGSAFGWAGSQNSGQAGASSQGSSTTGDAANQTQQNFADQGSSSS